MSDSRQAYLDAGLSFEEIFGQIQAECHVIGAKVKGYGTPARGEPKNARQVIFLVRTSKQACDLLYNAPDGLRGRYWQSPNHGFVATQFVIRSLQPALMTFAEHNPPVLLGRVADMSIEEIRCSLAIPSAKLWPRERDDDEASLLTEDKLLVPRWLENEQHAQINQGMWRLTPTGSDLEIKGGILGTDGLEYVPNGKRDRSCQIHRFGFT
ncbi:hypothetical protein [Mesorhizobium sp. B1-1-7]|uniref:hypothetical protein n=1 Tax=Mesorhizobium sp. B1-1-7 TaxID=2589977 RepID=UPI0011281C9E|nr:hypothetical protein [Mesorhizobium sp. B1-1-7]TPN46362.1 hypothetical protein FJ978_24860 [Mesorhizobium sp. B1-1-7]